MRSFTFLLFLLSGVPSLSRSADTTLSICGAVVSLRVPAEPHTGTILMLPGWNYSRTDCCDHSTFCEEALHSGFALVLPEMEKSIYIRTVYPQTKKEWRQALTLSWVVDSLIPELQQMKKLLLPGDNNFVFGISSGARGGAMIAEATGSLFRAAALLSGDYDQTLDSLDRLMTGYLGSFKNFPERWSGENNPRVSARRLEIPVYVGHGAQDRVVPVWQSTTFFETLRSLHPATASILHIDSTGEHSYHYWGSETKNILEFFGRYKR